MGSGSSTRAASLPRLSAAALPLAPPALLWPFRRRSLSTAAVAAPAAEYRRGGAPHHGPQEARARQVGRAPRAGPARNRLAGPCLGRRQSPWASTTRPAAILGRARHGPAKNEPARARARAGRAGGRMAIYTGKPRLNGKLESREKRASCELLGLFTRLPSVKCRNVTFLFPLLPPHPVSGRRRPPSTTRRRPPPSVPARPRR